MIHEKHEKVKAFGKESCQFLFENFAPAKKLLQLQGKYVIMARIIKMEEYVCE